MAGEFIFDSDDFVAFCAEFNSIPVDELTDSLLEVYLQDLNDRWWSVQRSYRSLRTDSDPKLDKGMLDAAAGKYLTCTKNFHQVKAKMLDVQKMFTATAPVNTSHTIPAEQSFAHFSVPPCDTDVFYGGYEEWPSFRDMFTAVYIDNPRIPPVQKLYHLRLKVQGQAGAIIKKYKLCSDNFKLAWEALQDRYENQRILVENQLKILLNLSPISVESSAALQNLQSTINDCLAAIKAQDVPIGDWDPFIIMLCASKLPMETLSLWEQSLASHRNLVKWEKLDTFLSHRCEVVERLESRNQDYDSHNLKRKPTSIKTHASKIESPPHLCKMCGSAHALKNCSKFMNLTPHARNQFVSENKICLNCLAYTHLRSDCPSKFVCSHCDKNHHSLLHFAKRELRNPNTQLNEKPETSAQGRARGALSTATHVANTENPSASDTTLLPTSVVDIFHQGENFKARAFLDQGSEKTFISKSLQQKLRLPTKPRAFQIHGIGGQVIAQSNSICQVTLYSKNQNVYVDMQAIVVPKITRMLPTCSISAYQVSHSALRELNLADPEFHVARRVDLLIGSNVLPRVFQEGTKKISPSLMAQSTIFGWVISGIVNVEPVTMFSLGVTEIESDPLADQFNGDIEKMYRQILVHKEDIQFQRILFRQTPSDPIKDFALKTVTFGVNCAPYLAIRTLIQLARDSAELFPQAANILTKETYVDDILSGSHDISSAIDSLQQLIFVLQSAGFPLKKITSNCPAILASVPKTDVLDNNFLKFKEASATKTLGIRWNALSDCFSYTVESIPPTTSLTKRQLLSHVAKLFDPAGWISPVVVQAKIMLQQRWLEGTGWDEAVKPSTLQTWNTFLENLPILSSLEIPRWLGYAPDQIVQIHGFCDASEKAYCAAVYLRVQYESSITSHLLVAKTKVAPIAPVTLARLELCGAVLLAKLIKVITHSFSFHNHECYLWTDSTIVLGWLEKPPNTWKTYIANRTAEIRRNVENIPWRHVRSNENPADFGSRGCRAEHLIHNSLWWTGPEWLKKTAEEWPKPMTFTEHSLEVKQKTLSFHIFTDPQSNDNVDTKDDLLCRFSKWDKAVRVMTYIYRFIEALRKRPLPLPGNLISQVQETTIPNPCPAASLTIPIISCEEFSDTKFKLLRLTQMYHYSDEFYSLTHSGIVPKKSPLYNLNPYLDEKQVMRTNGRISNAAISFNERHPIILPVKSTYCRLFIEYTHNLLLHAEVNLLLRAIRGEYFVPRLRPALRHCIRKCITCIRYKKQVKSQIMAALPLERSSFSLPFTYTGLDFAGPFLVKTSLVRNAPYHKGYVCVFVCFCTKAIHLELCSDLTASCFQAAFTRFIGRRGLPKKVMSDNGTNFVGAEREIRLEYEEFLKNVSRNMTSSYACQGLQWVFIPPNAPHMGGLWEAGVKSFKMHFKKVAKTYKYTFEEFTTLLTRIESVLNSRPLSPMSDDPDELLAITPGHLLRGAPLLALPEVPLQSLTFRSRWEKLKLIHHQFAQRWKDEYLKDLQKRYKWQHVEENINVGQLVIIKDDLLPPNEWKLARIIKIYFGTDGCVRVADLKTQTGTVTRAIAKLCVLPLIHDDTTTTTN